MELQNGGETPHNFIHESLERLSARYNMAISDIFAPLIMTKDKGREKQMNTNIIDSLIKQLSDKDGQVREKARLTLVDIGKETTAPLTKLLTAKEKQTRWEAAKALVAIADPSAIPELVKTLGDKLFDVRWLAAEALVAIGPECIASLLETLNERSDELFLREEARHVIKYIMRDNPKALELKEILKPVVAALEGSIARVEVPSAARTALEKLRGLKITL
jgi:HEAT repeat protein